MRFERQYGNGIRAFAGWAIRPASERGVENAFEAVFSLAGPHLGREFAYFQQHESGKRLLAERPDLLATLRDRPALAAMPAGSLGRAYYDFTGGDAIATADEFAALAHVDEICARLGWDGDVAWFLERMSHSHDLFHVLTGYGSDVAGEGAVIHFTYGHFPMAALWGITTTLSALRPRIGYRRWHAYLAEARERGRSCERLSTAEYERLFPLPVEEAQRVLRIAPVAEAHPREGIVVDPIFRRRGAGLA